MNQMSLTLGSDIGRKWSMPRRPDDPTSEPWNCTEESGTAEYLSWVFLLQVCQRGRKMVMVHVCFLQAMQASSGTVPRSINRGASPAPSVTARKRREEFGSKDDVFIIAQWSVARGGGVTAAYFELRVEGSPEGRRSTFSAQGSRLGDGAAGRMGWNIMGNMSWGPSSIQKHIYQVYRTSIQEEVTT
ncbi:hypothetical protein BDN67DRAFT_980470 [Paxillus ammoniavirescens]|nr:hypothetical protein BDN67DRAFT_980470 [Paxillus ammoniavirescens]